MGFRYYFHFTLNDYDELLEPEVPTFEARVNTFKKLSIQIGKKRVVWRYDPIIISNYTTPEFHLKKFSNIAKELSGFTQRVVISYADYYQKTNRRLLDLTERYGINFDVEAANSGYSWDLIKEISVIAKSHDMEIFTCAEERNFTDAGAPPGRCIDGELLHELWSLHGHDKKDPTQRETCLCAVSKDIGINDTCVHGCTYCYSTRNITLAKRRYSEHNPDSPVLWGNSRELSEEEHTNQQKVRLL